jgi:hypothetical protein
MRARSELVFQSSACGQRLFHTIVHQQVITIYATCSVLHVHALPSTMKLLLCVRCFKSLRCFKFVPRSCVPLSPSQWLALASLCVCVPMCCCIACQLSCDGCCCCCCCCSEQRSARALVAIGPENLWTSREIVEFSLLWTALLGFRAGHRRLSA